MLARRIGRTRRAGDSGMHEGDADDHPEASARRPRTAWPRSPMAPPKSDIAAFVIGLRQEIEHEPEQHLQVERVHEEFAEAVVDGHPRPPGRRPRDRPNRRDQPQQDDRPAEPGMQPAERLDTLGDCSVSGPGTGSEPVAQHDASPVPSRTTRVPRGNFRPLPVSNAPCSKRGPSPSYSAVPAVRDLSFTLAPGGILGLLGPNGSGKSTTVSILTGAARAVRAGRSCSTDARSATTCSPTRRASATSRKRRCSTPT